MDLPAVPTKLTATTHRIYYDEYLASAQPTIDKVLARQYLRSLRMANFDRIHGLGFLYTNVRNLILLGEYFPSAAAAAGTGTGASGNACDGADISKRRKVSRGAPVANDDSSISLNTKNNVSGFPRLAGPPTTTAVPTPSARANANINAATITADPPATAPAAAPVSCGASASAAGSLSSLYSPPRSAPHNTTTTAATAATAATVSAPGEIHREQQLQRINEEASRVSIAIPDRENDNHGHGARRIHSGPAGAQISNASANYNAGGASFESQSLLSTSNSLDNCSYSNYSYSYNYNDNDNDNDTPAYSNGTAVSSAAASLKGALPSSSTIEEPTVQIDEARATAASNTREQQRLGQSSELKVIRKQQPDHLALLSTFDLACLPTISLKKFLERINKFLMPPIQVYIATLYFLHRLFFKDPTTVAHLNCMDQNFQITDSNCYKLVLCYLRLAEKLICDGYTSQDRYWKIVGWNKHNRANRQLEINGMELLDFDLHVNDEILDHHLQVIKDVNLRVQELQQRELQKHEEDADGDTYGAAAAQAAAQAAATTTVSTFDCLQSQGGNGGDQTSSAAGSPSTAAEQQTTGTKRKLQCSN